MGSEYLYGTLNMLKAANKLKIIKKIINLAMLAKIRTPHINEICVQLEEALVYVYRGSPNLG